MNPYATATGIACSLLVVWATLAQFQAPAGADALQSIPEGLRAEGALIPLAWPLRPRVPGCVWRSAPIEGVSGSSGTESSLQVARLASTAASAPHRTLAPDPWYYPTSFMVGMLRFDMAKESAAMKCLRIYATPDGESHFDEVQLPTTKRSVHPDAVPFEVSASYQASRVRLTRQHPSGHARGCLAYGPRAGAYGQAGWFG